MAEDRPGGSGELNIPEEIVVLRIKNGVLFPFMMVPVAVTDRRDVEVVEEAAAHQPLIMLVTQKDPKAERPGPEGLYQVGTVAVIHKMLQFPDGSRRLLIRGLTRAKVLEWTQTEPHLRAKIEPIEEIYEEDAEADALAQSLLTTFQRIVELSPHLSEDAYIQALNVGDPGTLADFIASNLNVPIEKLQQVLEEANVKQRLRLVNELAQQALVRLELIQRVTEAAREEIEKSQRQYLLREQLKAIQRELGEEDPEIAELRRRIEEAGLPPEAREAAERELDRLSRMNPASAEYTVARTYIEWLIELPWNKLSEETIDIERARKILDEDHYDLEDVKERILEYLAVRKLKPDAHGPILCFVGPPGVGKTSLGRSIARATGRKFVRISLGGVRDEAEIRGHRRTYVGAMPGRIIQGIRRAGTRNPVFMLDEVDKIGTDFRGDPAAALLEVLDPEQNRAFSDHYIEVPFDLSQVMFICTANVTETIPPALLDRMEVLRLPGYTDDEKLKIARNYLLPRQIREHGLSAEQVQISDGALRKIISEYTREAGVRGLERQIAAICRKLARMVAEGERDLPRVTARNLHEFLGHPRFYREVAERITVPGVVCGLAWTQAGGEVLFVEATKMPGRGELVLTGHVGQVMKESAEAALSYVRANAHRWGIGADEFRKNDFHIHVPAGAVPKDGPSAGVAMVTALVSVLTGRLARSNVAMTGEITLRGKVLPVGGIKEKVLAAKRAGIDTVILPSRNKGDVAELPEQLKRGMKFVFVDRVDEVVDAALEPAREMAEAAAGS